MSDNRKNSKKDEVPIWFKPTLSIEETSRYSGIGMSKLYELTNPKIVLLCCGLEQEE